MVKHEGIVRRVNFSLIDVFVETCDVLVFPLSMCFLPLYTLEPNLSQASTLTSVEVTIAALRTRTDIPHLF